MPTVSGCVICFAVCKEVKIAMQIISNKMLFAAAKSHLTSSLFPMIIYEAVNRKILHLRAG